MRNNYLQFKIDLQKTVLSSESSCYKTENFAKQTKYISNVDFFVSKIADGILLHLSDLLVNENLETKDSVNCFRVKTESKDFVFLIKLGYQLGNQFSKKDIIFFEYVEDQSKIKQNDQRFNDFAKNQKNINIIVEKTRKFARPDDFNRVYHISTTQGINLPKLSLEQKSIVETVDQNVLVQGVAGSGKTNICIDKIVFTACKNYGGKVLYSTYSRGLLIDTKLRVDAFRRELEVFDENQRNGNIVFLDNNHKKALENKFGIYFFSDDDEKIFEKIRKIIDYLRDKVDYLLIEDIYRNKFGESDIFVDEAYFKTKYAKNLKNHQISVAFKKLEKYSLEIVYKEIFGMIFGKYDLNNKTEILSLENYIEERKDSFSVEECKTIYQIAVDYKNFLQKENLIDSNTASKKILNNLGQFEEYSLIVLDEVQDFSEANLCLFKKMSLKLFCVGDALQMINPSYFNFGYLKNLLYEKDVVDVKQLKYNYRNTKKIEEIIDSLAKINTLQFGTHNFVVEGKSVDSGLKTKAIFVKDNHFVNEVSKSKFDNFTFIVGSLEEKKKLREKLPNQEILTVSGIKGLERNTVVVYNVLSDNKNIWDKLLQMKINHKQADENSVYRYYYNLFYVAVSRAKQNLFVVEKENIECFEEFFQQNFDKLQVDEAIETLTEIVSKIESTQEEILSRIKEFIKLEQYDNAVFAANKIADDVVKIRELKRISISETLIKVGRYREAGVSFWQAGMLEDAKEQFVLSGDLKLIELLDACSGNGETRLGYEIVDYYDAVKDNEVAREFILSALKEDIENLKTTFKNIHNKLEKGRK